MDLIDGPEYLSLEITNRCSHKELALVLTLEAQLPPAASKKDSHTHTRRQTSKETQRKPTKK